MSATQPILEARQDGGTAPGAATEHETPATECGRDITNNLDAVMALGFVLAVIEPTETPSPTHWDVPGVHGEAVGTHFTARVVRALAPDGARPPDTLDVRSWEAVVYGRVRDVMEPTDDSPGHATPRLRGRMLALLRPDGMGATRGWRLARSWHLRADDRIEGAALNQGADTPVEVVFDAYAANLSHARLADADAGPGGAR